MNCFRYGKHYLENDVEKRTLMKVFGVRINIVVNGRVNGFAYRYSHITEHSHIHFLQPIMFFCRQENLISFQR